ncbi:hypothetical protein [Acidicapsa ligni]|uniref:hypothetical protein n=1 Tax=Acidicapsa ligni TaxID=542300 RepID=UPI0021E0CE7B|nr:hypothetical protein [Acidicapsa ligni]
MRINGNAYIYGLTIFSVVSVVAHSQIVPSQATNHEINLWLRDGDPRMVAWGATFAAKSGDKDELPVLAALAENYESVPRHEYDARGNYIPRTPEQKQYLDSMQAVLDSIIQLHGEVSCEAVVAVVPDFPAQALTLLATMPEPERSQCAADIYETRDKSDQPYDWHRIAHLQMIHMAAAILALHPPPGFTATLLNEATVILKISVTDDDQKDNGPFSSGTCGDSFGLVAAPGWPQPYTYVVEQHWNSQGPAEGILIPGEPAITGRRALSNSSCSTLPGFTSVQKVLLARQEASLLPGDPGPGTYQHDTLRYTGRASFLASLSVMITLHEEPFQKLAATLASKSYLTATESATVMPTFAVEVEDQRKNQSQALQIPESLGPHTTVGPYKHESGWFPRQLD